MKKIIFAILIAFSFCCASHAKDPRGKVCITLNDGRVINGYCENMFKHERPAVKVSPQPDGKDNVKYQATDISELRYEIPNDTVIEF
ncbi:MAG: hypothetical protein K2I39_05750 [Muribaculaceae bacterium]|nr:hypothetical protein [Muribaculaceae bacterium]